MLKNCETSLTGLISVDSYGWVERFTNGDKAAQYNQIIDSNQPKNIITSVVVLYEVYKKVKQRKSEEEALLAVAALSQTTIVPIDQTISLEAADYSLKITYISPTPLFTLLPVIGKLNYTLAIKICVP